MIHSVAAVTLLLTIVSLTTATNTTCEGCIPIGADPVLHRGSALTTLLDGRSGKFAFSAFDGRYFWLAPLSVQVSPVNRLFVIRLDPHGGGLVPFDFPATIPAATSHAYQAAVYDDHQGVWMAPSSAGAYFVKVNTTDGTMTAHGNTFPTRTGADVPTSNGAFNGGFFDGENVWFSPLMTDDFVAIGYRAANKSCVWSWPAGYDSKDAGMFKFSGAAFDGTNAWASPSQAPAIISVHTATGKMTAHTNWPDGFTKNTGATFSPPSVVGRHVWFPPRDASHVIRYDLDTNTMRGYNVWPTAGFVFGSGGLRGFVSAQFDGEAVWLSPGGANQIVRLDPDTGNMLGFNDNGMLPLMGFLHTGAFFDGKSLWLTPNEGNYFVEVTHSCSNATNCNGNAVEVSRDAVKGCTCTCKEGYAGAACDTCAANFTGSPHQNPVVPCTPVQCNNSANCNGNAANVSGDLVSGCTCTCMTGYGGPACDTCAVNYTGSPLANPATPCKPQLCMGLNCNGNAMEVGGDLVNGCICTCVPGYAGATCDTCAANYTGAPLAVPSVPCTPIKCTSESNCNGNAASVSGDLVTGCTCTCKPGYTGQACGTCAANYTGSPLSVPPVLCTPILCTSEANCNGNAMQVVGDLVDGCGCTCKPGYTGADCSSCSANYTGAPLANPATQCTPVLCSSEANCNGNAASVSGNLIDGCLCTCTTGYGGATCDMCATKYAGSPLANPAVPCTPILCSNETDCNSNAATVSGDRVSGCVCTCKAGYAGQACDTCAANYAGSPLSDPSVPCAPVMCTDAENCNGNAATVTGDLVRGCACTCNTGYAGATCNMCAANYNGSPLTSPAVPCSPTSCSSEANCNGNAAGVSGDLVSGCMCNCKTGYTGSSCSSCALGYTGSPLAAPPVPCAPVRCNNALSCTGNAVNVSGDILSGCICTCKSGYSGPRCSGCAANYSGSPVSLPAVPCAPILCSNEVDCNSNAATVSGDRVSGCVCTCKAGYTGQACDTCAANYTGSPVESPAVPCLPTACSNAANCNGNAVTVTGVVLNGCTCTCAASYIGATCQLLVTQSQAASRAPSATGGTTDAVTQLPSTTAPTTEAPRELALDLNTSTVTAFVGKVPLPILMNLSGTGHLPEDRELTTRVTCGAGCSVSTEKWVASVSAVDANRWQLTTIVRFVLSGESAGDIFPGNITVCASNVSCATKNFAISVHESQTAAAPKQSDDGVDDVVMAGGIGGAVLAVLVLGGLAIFFVLITKRKERYSDSFGVSPLRGLPHAEEKLLPTAATHSEFTGARDVELTEIKANHKNSSNASDDIWEEARETALAPAKKSTPWDAPIVSDAPPLWANTDKPTALKSSLTESASAEPRVKKSPLVRPQRDPAGLDAYL